MSTDNEKRLIDEKGRVTIPKSIREKLHLSAGEPVELDVEDGRIVIRPQIEREAFVERMRGCINASSRKMEAGSLTPEDLKADWTSDILPEQ